MPADPAATVTPRPVVTQEAAADHRSEHRPQRDDEHATPHDDTERRDRLDGVLAPAAQQIAPRYIRPLAGRRIRAMAWVGEHLLVLDATTGRLCVVDTATDDTRVINDGMSELFTGAGGLAVSPRATRESGVAMDTGPGHTGPGHADDDADSGTGADASVDLWFTTAAGLHRAAWDGAGGRPGDRDDLAAISTPEFVVAIEGAEAVASCGEALYVIRRTGVGTSELQVRSGADPAASPSATIALHGVSEKAIAATADTLWISDEVEQTVYNLDRATLTTRFTVVTPLEKPTAIAARPTPNPVARPSAGAHDELLVAYYENEPYLRDNPFIDPSWEVRYRDRAIVHELRVAHDPTARIAWSTGHRVEMHYYVDVEPDADIVEDHAATLEDLTWRIAIPLDTPRQRVVSIEPIGLPFELVDEPDLDGRPQRVAVFRVPRVDMGTRVILGWRAVMDMFGVKHQVSAADLDSAPALTARQMSDFVDEDDDLDLGTPEILAATATAVGEETNPLLRARRIRSYVYDRLEYEMGNADSPIGILERGTGSCGEHVSAIMALMRTDGLACRVAGRYKCPYHPWNSGPLYPDYNHVWVDLYLPGHGWVPVESNPDGDVSETGPYPDRFFMGLPWRHVEIGKDISFEKVTYDPGPQARRRRRIGARRLSRNHIRFDVLGELAPVVDGGGVADGA